MNRKLYVGNLPYTTTDQDLAAVFSQAGTVLSATVLREQATGRSRGFGFVEMATEEETQEAIGRFHDSTLGGRKLTVNVAKPREPMSGHRPERPSQRRGQGRREQTREARW